MRSPHSATKITMNAVTVTQVAVTLIRHTNHAPHPQTSGSAPTLPALQTLQEVLAERLARGEIEPDDYRLRLDALEHRPNAKP